MRHLLGHGRWRPARGYVLLLVATWFVFSGIAELIVSDMETWRRLWGAPSAASFALWRGRVDLALAVASALLVLSLIAYPVLRRATATGNVAGK